MRTKKKEGWGVQGRPAGRVKGEEGVHVLYHWGGGREERSYQQSKAEISGHHKEKDGRVGGRNEEGSAA